MKKNIRRKRRAATPLLSLHPSYHRSIHHPIDSSIQPSVHPMQKIHPSCIDAILDSSYFPPPKSSHDGVVDVLFSVRNSLVRISNVRHSIRLLRAADSACDPGTGLAGAAEIPCCLIGYSPKCHRGQYLGWKPQCESYFRIDTTYEVVSSFHSAV